jgi:hypothetical protein
VLPVIVLSETVAVASESQVINLDFGFGGKGKKRKRANSLLGNVEKVTLSAPESPGKTWEEAHFRGFLGQDRGLLFL